MLYTSILYMAGLAIEPTINIKKEDISLILICTDSIFFYRYSRDLEKS